MKIAFFSEIGTLGGVLYPRTFPNMRTDVAWSVALNAPIYKFPAVLNDNIDLGIIIIPKKNPKTGIDFFRLNKYKCKKWAVMQEANQTYWQNFAVPDQIEYLNLLHEVDCILCHNEMDCVYFDGLINAVKSFVMPSLMIMDVIPQSAKKVPQKRSGSVINGNWVEWYSAQDSYMIAREFDTEIYAPSMGRKQEYEDYLEDIIYFKYMNWADWMERLNNMQFAVNMMRTYAAGTFSLNCAALGIPCIGWDFMDTQRLCFPELSFKEGDMKNARKMAKHLKENQQFYDYCSNYAKKVWLDNFSETIFHNKINLIFNKLELK